ncbi:L-threonine synthase [Halanaerobium saccharolyticum]|uniref:Threonine synthase n=1 Tax=Halanaerobium saccharolyticum TaxID=43595 RepID=A0A4R7Z266_9FIRM|nr:threonine synthase [Halanaerobium saccharolyticum]RAK12766.1 L-threonine synthase [Halanaerobium saccharolyticum]TDW02979.1 L-threonine synthase [Halanaerobium saccharolyticum]TDX62837.1 L-threonine synthase [Halanaerobium saccharolyticum]
MKYVTGLHCIKCGKVYEADPERYLCDDCEDGILDVDYDYQKIKAEWSKEDLKANPDQRIWRYEPLLPINPETEKPKLAVGNTPIYKSEVLAEEFGIKELIIKDDGLNPTASLKDRASAMAVVKAQEAGAATVACSSTGNAASSLAGNIASMGGRMNAVIFVPDRAPAGKLAQLLIYGADVVSVKGSYEEAFYLSAAAIDKWGWYNRNAAINSYLVEGKKTVSLELAEQLEWEMPDWLVFSVGDGCTIAGAYKGIYDLKEIGFIDRIPKLLGVQAAGCAPITEAFRTGKDLEVTAENTIADSIAVGKPRNWLKAVRAVRDSKGEMINVSDEQILAMMRLLGKKTGIFGEPAGVAGLAGLKKAAAAGIVKADQSAAVVITGNGLKDVKNARRAAGDPIEVEPDLEKLTEIFAEKGVT